MNREELKEKLENLNKKMEGLKNKAKDTMDTAIILGLEGKDKIDDAIKETKSNINALKENYIILSKSVKGKASAELLKAQMNIDVAKKEIEKKKEIHDKKELEKYIESLVEYTQTCIILSELAQTEANLAKLELLKAQTEYEEKYEKE